MPLDTLSRHKSTNRALPADSYDNEKLKLIESMQTKRPSQEASTVCFAPRVSATVGSNLAYLQHVKGGGDMDGKLFLVSQDGKPKPALIQYTEKEQLQLKLAATIAQQSEMWGPEGQTVNTVNDHVKAPVVPKLTKEQSQLKLAATIAQQSEISSPQGQTITTVLSSVECAFMAQTPDRQALKRLYEEMNPGLMNPSEDFHSVLNEVLALGRPISASNSRRLLKAANVDLDCVNLAKRTARSAALHLVSNSVSDCLSMMSLGIENEVGKIAMWAASPVLTEATSVAFDLFKLMPLTGQINPCLGIKDNRAAEIALSEIVARLSVESHQTVFETLGAWFKERAESLRKTSKPVINEANQAIDDSSEAEAIAQALPDTIFEAEFEPHVPKIREEIAEELRQRLVSNREEVVHALRSDFRQNLIDMSKWPSLLAEATKSFWSTNKISQGRTPMRLAPMKLLEYASRGHISQAKIERFIFEQWQAQYVEEHLPDVPLEPTSVEVDAALGRLKRKLKKVFIAAYSEPLHTLQPANVADDPAIDLSAYADLLEAPPEDAPTNDNGSLNGQDLIASLSIELETQKYLISRYDEIRLLIIEQTRQILGTRKTYHLDEIWVKQVTLGILRKIAKMTTSVGLTAVMAAMDGGVLTKFVSKLVSQALIDSAFAMAGEWLEMRHKIQQVTETLLTSYEENVHANDTEMALQKKLKGLAHQAQIQFRSLGQVKYEFRKRFEVEPARAKKRLDIAANRCAQEDLEKLLAMEPKYRPQEKKRQGLRDQLNQIDFGLNRSSYDSDVAVIENLIRVANDHKSYTREHFYAFVLLHADALFRMSLWSMPKAEALIKSFQEAQKQRKDEFDQDRYGTLAQLRTLFLSAEDLINDLNTAHKLADDPYHSAKIAKRVLDSMGGQPISSPGSEYRHINKYVNIWYEQQALVEKALKHALEPEYLKRLQKKLDRINQPLADREKKYQYDAYDEYDRNFIKAQYANPNVKAKGKLQNARIGHQQENTLALLNYCVLTTRSVTDLIKNQSVKKSERDIQIPDSETLKAMFKTLKKDASTRFESRYASLLDVAHLAGKVAVGYGQSTFPEDVARQEQLPISLWDERQNITAQLSAPRREPSPISAVNLKAEGLDDETLRASIKTLKTDYELMTLE